jgi:hypothetical protein
MWWTHTCPVPSAWHRSSASIMIDLGILAYEAIADALAVRPPLEGPSKPGRQARYKVAVWSTRLLAGLASGQAACASGR